MREVFLDVSCHLEGVPMGALRHCLHQVVSSCVNLHQASKEMPSNHRIRKQQNQLANFQSGDRMIHHDLGSEKIGPYLGLLWS